jgi:hypothetical protein
MGAAILTWLISKPPRTPRDGESVPVLGAQDSNLLL